MLQLELHNNYYFEMMKFKILWIFVQDDGQ